MKAEGADYDIHLVWNVKEIINKVGPEKAIREMKKRCEAGAIIGCTIYKRLIEHWLLVAMSFQDKAGRGPAEQFMAAAGEDEWVQKVERLHEEFPNGIPRSKQLDLIDEFNTNLERKVGRGIPLEPGDATEEDIKESKRIAGQMARHEKVTPPKPAPPEKESPPPPPKEKEKPRPEPVRAAPEEPIIPIPEKPGGKAPELDLMKQEIEERIARMRAEKARGELKAGESKEMQEDISLLFRGVQDYVDIKEYKFYDSTKANNLLRKNCPICTGGDYPRRKEIFADPGFIKKLELEMLSFLVAHEQEHIENPDAIGDEFGASLGAIKRMKMSREEAEKLAVRWYKIYWYKTPIISRSDFTDAFQKILKKYEKTEIKLDDIETIPKEKRIELAKRIASGEIEIREGLDMLTEPKDYNQWTFADFEGLLPGLESVEDLEELYEQVGASEVIPDSDKESLRNLIKERIDVVKRFYTEWAAKEGK